ncbi:transcriptional regulator, DeoR family [Mariniphaga anaerophila]|uniref:Transcriptional regulator, DeoR family n=1 Tax=Mariniphaga anaerophila TaxID=1484053 RepID=A0A1M5FH54_9BACT|nr:DeoR/GlpR family DNA-binding transcription regulator [Mariniphaga anaerophila]SHF90825.1 transcriptional regulator, DeoR family [Mariniphaga anaerophila]
MLSIAERHKYILDMLNKNGFIKVSDISKELDVTPVTIRKDLKYLEEKKLLYRTHGSASPVNPHTADINLQEKEKMRTSEKKRIAMAACKLIEENDSIIIASGSTAHTFAQELNPKGNLTVVSASLKTSILLNNIPNIEVIQLGGIVRKNSFSVVGDFAAQPFNDLTCSKLFLGVDGIDFENGITNSNIEEAILNKKMMNAALRTIILSDSSKFGKRGFGRICPLDQVDTIITDSGIPQQTAIAIEEMGIELIIV